MDNGKGRYRVTGTACVNHPVRQVHKTRGSLHRLVTLRHRHLPMHHRRRNNQGTVARHGGAKPCSDFFQQPTLNSVHENRRCRAAARRITDRRRVNGCSSTSPRLFGHVLSGRPAIIAPTLITSLRRCAGPRYGSRQLTDNIGIGRCRLTKTRARAHHHLHRQPMFRLHHRVKAMMLHHPMKIAAAALLLAASLAVPATVYADCGDPGQDPCTGPVPTVDQVVAVLTELTDPEYPPRTRATLSRPGFSLDEAGTIDDHLNRTNAFGYLP